MRPSCFIEVRFDDTDGQTVCGSMPPDVELSERVKTSLKFHALPDTTMLPGDSVFAFRIKSPIETAEVVVPEKYSAGASASASASAESASTVAEAGDNDAAQRVAIDNSGFYAHTFYRVCFVILAFFVLVHRFVCFVWLFVALFMCVSS